MHRSFLLSSSFSFWYLLKYTQAMQKIFFSIEGMQQGKRPWHQPVLQTIQLHLPQKQSFAMYMGILWQWNSGYNRSSESTLSSQFQVSKKLITQIIYTCRIRNPLFCPQYIKKCFDNIPDCLMLSDVQTGSQRTGSTSCACQTHHRASLRVAIAIFNADSATC